MERAANADTSDAAQAVIMVCPAYCSEHPGLLMPHKVAEPFCRYYVNAGNVPKALRWVPSASLIKHAFEGLCDNEFPGLRFDPKSVDGSGDILQGEQVRCWCPHSQCYPCVLMGWWPQESHDWARIGSTGTW